MSIKAICGAVLAYIVGIARIAGGVISIYSSSSMTETVVGIFLILIGLFILLSITMLLQKRSMFWLKILSASVIIFWIDGIVNGYLLYGSPQMSGQIINLCCSMAILLLSRSIATEVNN